MELSDIHRITKLSLRKLRYVLDHRILPGMRVRTDSSRVGHPRRFLELEGYSIALAAALLEAGVRRDMVARFFDAMVEFKWQGFSPQPTRRLVLLECAFLQSVNPARAEIADGRYLRVTMGKKVLKWIDLRSSRFNSVRYVPRVVVAVNLVRLRDEFRS